jgi:hypothetical protein
MNHPLTHDSLESRVTPQGHIPHLTKLVHHDIPDIVSSIRILCTRIAESDDEFHRIILSYWGTQHLLVYHNILMRSRFFASSEWQERYMYWVYRERRKSATKNLPWPRDNLLF